MTCPGTAQAIAAGQENPRCLRCDKPMPEGECTCAYGIKPSPLSSVEVVVDTEDPDAIRLLRSLGARYSRAHGWFIKPSRAERFEMLWKAEVVALGGHKYRFPDGSVRDIYQSVKHLRGK